MPSFLDLSPDLFCLRALIVLSQSLDCYRSVTFVLFFGGRVAMYQEVYGPVLVFQWGMQAAPGIDNFMLAPNSSKYWQEPRSSAARSLNFGPTVKVARQKL
ncbi:hypothetical protein POM88_010472 [Heracleum sosnowskyi]|uniref:Uncharacterized protein n=1 Tax=Heracleum sosnowskyi TaxID=360622 RepID=A0AAD8ITJ1_9APIA|nr:hypothetical protein POM88_010472 [Heracleum sosnowskyi]